MKRNNGIKIIQTARFLRSAQRLPKSIMKKSQIREAIFRKDPFDQRLRTHKLHGALDDFYAYSVDYHYRIIFRFLDSQTVAYHEIGTHDVYGAQ